MEKDPYKGTYWCQELLVKNDMSIWQVGRDGDSHVADFTGSEAENNAREYVTYKNNESVK